MANLNLVLIAGNLTRDPELRFTSAGTAVCNLGMAINRKWTNKDGKKQEEVTFVEVTVWGRMAESVAEYLQKGSSALIQGHLQLEQWEDKKTGAKKSKLKVVAENVQFLGSWGKKANDDKRGNVDDLNENGRESGGNRRDPNDDVPF